MRIKLLAVFLLVLALNSCGYFTSKKYQGYVEGENIYLASPYSGVLMQLDVMRGQKVKKGELLFTLDADPQQIAVKQTEAELLQAQLTLKDLESPRRLPEREAIKAQIAETEAKLELAKIRLRRNKKLYQKAAIDKDAVDAAETTYQGFQQLKLQYQANLALANLGSRENQINAQKAQVKALVSKLNNAKWQLEQKRIYAPADGVIYDTFYRKGEFVGSQQAVLALLTPDNTRIEFFIPVVEVAKIKAGQKIQFTCDGCKNPGEATISYISPEAEYIPPLVYTRENNDKLVFQVKAEMKNPEDYKPGQPVSVTL